MSGYPYQPNSMSPSQLGVRPAPALVQQLLIGAFGWMFAGLLLTAAVAFLVTTSPAFISAIARLWFVVVIGQLVLGIGIQAAINRLSPTLSLALFFVFAASMGLTLGVIVTLYTGESVAAAFVSASAMFGAAAAYGAVTKRSLAGVGGIAYMGVVGLFVAMMVNLFLRSSAIGWVISIIGVVLFTVLTAYDVQKISRGDYAAVTGSQERASILAALHLYLDFINLFLFLLRLMGSSRN
jgi:FtsH-binding integral membrane protein